MNAFVKASRFLMVSGNVPECIINIDLDMEPLTPKKVIENRKEYFKGYKENMYKFIDLMYLFTIGSAGVFGVVTTKTQIFDTSEVIHNFLLFYICLSALCVLVGKVLDPVNVNAFRLIKVCVSGSFWGVLGFVVTALCHLKNPKYEWFIGIATFVAALVVLLYLKRNEEEHYLELLDMKEEKNFYKRFMKNRSIKMATYNSETQGSDKDTEVTYNSDTQGIDEVTTLRQRYPFNNPLVFP